MRNLICLLLLFTALIAGCQPAPTPAAQAVSPTAAPSPTSQPTEPPLDLQSCIVASKSIDAKCGTLRVPEDRANPTGWMLDLDLVVVPARNSPHEPDPFFFLAGGPGGAATESGSLYNAKTIFWKINASRDIVFLDQRGTNGSHKLACGPIPFEVINATQQQMDDWTRQCLSTLKGDPRFYTTAEAVRDLDAARAALGYDKINLYGISYGVTAAQVYMRLFPQHVRAAVLDHGTALDTLFGQVEPRVSEAALKQVLTYCEQDEKCRAAFPDIRKDWQAILDRLAKGPVKTNYIPEGASEPGQVDLNMLADGVHSLLFKSGGYAVLPGMIHMLASTEDWTEPVKQISEQYGSSSGSDEPFLLMKQEILCFEPAWGFDPETIARLNADTYNREMWVRSAKITQKICAALPKPEPAQIYPPGKPAPLNVLAINSLLDPQNPPSNIEPALKEFTQSRLIVEPAEGHETSINSCRWDLIADYIEKGTAEGLNAACLENAKPMFMISP